jgi:glycosyltransferase involved in cell wall biosynthesis
MHDAQVGDLAPRSAEIHGTATNERRSFGSPDVLAAHATRRFERTRWPRPAHVRVSLVIPAMNEEKNIGWVLGRVPETVDEVILVDGNSKDNTVPVSRAIRPDIRIVGQDRPGKGAALRAGFAAARGDFIVMIDADRSMDPAEIQRYLDLLEQGHDLVKGSRFMGDGGTPDMELIRFLGNGVLRGLVNGLFRTDFTDLCYGFFAFRRDRLDDLALCSDGFEIETELVVRAVKAGLHIGEVPSFESPRAYGESHRNIWRDGWRVLKTLLRHRLMRKASAPLPDATSQDASSPHASEAAIEITG